MVTKLNRKSLRAQQARKESGSLRVCSHCPSLCCTQTGKKKEKEREREVTVYIAARELWHAFLPRVLGADRPCSLPRSG